MKKLKYVIVTSYNIEAPIVFPGDLIQHNEVWRWDDAIVSAGFCQYDPRTGWECWGESVSLKKESRPKEDKEILNKFLFAAFGGVS